MSKAFRWILVVGFIVLLIAFPRGPLPPPEYSETQSGLHPFSWTQYGLNLHNLWHHVSGGSLGTTVDGRPIAGILADAVPQSLQLIGIALVFSLVVGVAKGIFDGMRAQTSMRGGLVSDAVQWLVEATPDFFLIFALEIVGFYLDKHGANLYFVGSHQFLTGTVVPAIILALLPTAYLTRMVRLTVEDQFGQPYITTARAKGLTGKTVIRKHILPNALHTVFISLLPVIGMLFSNLVIVEYLFYRTGVVSTLFYAMGNRGADNLFTFPTGTPIHTKYYPFDASLILALVLICGLLFLVCFGIARIGLLAFGYRGQSNPYSGNLSRETSSRNWQGWLGAAMVGIVVLAGALGNRLNLPDPEKIILIQADHGHYTSPPFPPSPVHWAGTDVLGRDLLSRVIHDTLPTFGEVFLMMALLLLTGVVLAVCASVFRIAWLRFFVNTWNSVTTVIPGVIGALFILEIPAVYWWGYRANGSWSGVHSVAYILTLWFLEGGRMGYQLMLTLDDAQAKEYMEAANVSGNSAWTGFLLHGLGPLRQAVVEQGLIAFSRILLLMATIGFFHIGWSQAWVLSQTDGFVVEATSPDWASLFSQNSRDLLGSEWVLFAPALWVTWTIIGANLLLTGVRRHAEAAQLQSRRRHSCGYRLVVWLRRNRPAKPDASS